MVSAPGTICYPYTTVWWYPRGRAYHCVNDVLRAQHFYRTIIQFCIKSAFLYTICKQMWTLHGIMYTFPPVFMQSYALPGVFLRQDAQQQPPTFQTFSRFFQPPGPLLPPFYPCSPPPSSYPSQPHPPHTIPRS